MKDKKPASPSSAEESKDEKKFPGYPIYPESEDIYSKDRKVIDPRANPDIVNRSSGEKLNKPPDPDDYPGMDNQNDDFSEMNEKDFTEDVSGDDLDVPGADLDDDEEEIGNEDEENNYYSLGGDDHDDLEEDRGE